MESNLFHTLLFGLGGLAMVALVLKSPRFATLLAVSAIPLYIVKFPFAQLPLNYWEMLVVVLSLLQIHRIAEIKNIFSSLKPFGVWGVLLIGVGLIAGTLVAPDLPVALGIIKGWFVIPILLGLSIWANHTKGFDILVVRALILGCLPLALTAIFQMITGDFITLDSRASGWFLSANYLGLFLVPVILLSARGIFVENRLDRILVILSLGLTMIAVLGSHSLGSISALLVGVLVIISGTIKPTKAPLAITGLVVFLAVASYFLGDRLEAFFVSGGSSSWDIRLQIWSVSLAMLKEHWLTGIGLGAFSSIYPQIVTTIFPNPLEHLVLHPHNLFLAWAINTGLAGLGGFIFVVIQWWRTVSNISDNLWRASLFSSMLALLVHGLLDTQYFKNDLSASFWIIVFLSLSLNVSSQKSQKV